MFGRLGRWCYDHRWQVIGAWFVALLGVNAIAAGIGASFDSAFEIPASESADGFDVVDEHFPGAGSGFGGSIVFRADAGISDPAVQEAMTELFDEVDEIDGVSLVSPYSPFGVNQVAEGGLIAFAQVNLASSVDQTEAGEIGAEIRDQLPEIDGLDVEVGGAALAEFEPPETELIGLAFAVVVLILSFGSVLAMGLPIGVALAGVGTGLGVVTLLTQVLSIPDFATIIGAMIGLGVGIDYALFIVTRYRELTREGHDLRGATVGSMDTAGRAVAFAGMTVVVSLLGMVLIGLPFITGLGVAAATTVAVTMFASITLLPALLSLAAERVEITRWRGLITAGFVAVALLGVGLGVPGLALVGLVFAAVTLAASFVVAPLRREVPPRRERPRNETFAYKWSHLIQARPWVFLIVGSAILLVLAAPVLGLRLGFSDEGNFAESTDTRRAYDLVSEGFGPGFNGPFLVAMTTSGPAEADAVPGVVQAIASTPGIASVGDPFPSDQDDPSASDAWLVQVIPDTSPQDEATEDTVVLLRDEILPAAVTGTGIEAFVTGAVPANIDFTSYLSGRLVVFLGAVLAVSFLLLMMVFRSLLVPLKAVIMNMLGIASAYGVVVAIFQWGWLKDIFGVEPAPIEPFLPMMLFAIVFGLSMDYEVFLLSRVKEEFERTGDAKNSVADGLAATARVITAAAAIMVVVFGAFLLEDDRIVKLFGTGLATAVLLDATLVRMLLVPATMELLGAKNWWLPEWLDRILPRIDVEGPSSRLDSDASPDGDGPPESNEPALAGRS